MKLFFSPFSPFVRKCLVAAHELGLGDQVTLMPANVHPVQRDQDVIKHNPLGKVPTLLTDDGQVLYDSRVICEYLNDLAGGSLVPARGPARWSALTLQSLGDGMLDGAVLARYEAAARPAALQWDAWRAGQLDKVETSLASLEAQRQLLNGEALDIGQIAVACALWYLDLRFANFGWRERFPRVAGWHADACQHPSLRITWSI